MINIRLKRCPFCGGKAKLDDCRTIWRVVCEDCGSLTLGDRAPEPENDEHCDKIDWDHYEKTAIDRWNSRVR